MNKLTFMLIK